MDFRDCKAAASRLLPAGHPIREALLMEDDWMPRDVGLVKVATYVGMLNALRRGRT